jgi:hypothetical protein
MAYEHFEDIQGRRSEKIALFLTIENAMGLVLAAFPAYLATASQPFVLRILVVGAAAALGVVATLDVGGMTGYERVVWRVRGALRQRISPPLLTPERLVGAATTVRHDRPLAVGGPIQRRDVGRIREPVPLAVPARAPALSERIIPDADLSAAQLPD